MLVRAKNRIKKYILIVGATGLLGEPIARQLQKDGYAIRIFANNYRKQRKNLTILLR